MVNRASPTGARGSVCGVSGRTGEPVDTAEGAIRGLRALAETMVAGTLPGRSARILATATAENAADARAAVGQTASGAADFHWRASRAAAARGDNGSAAQLVSVAGSNVVHCAGDSSNDLAQPLLQ